MPVLLTILTSMKTLNLLLFCAWIAGQTQYLSAGQTSALWGKDGESWTAESRLPDFSFAGYRCGEAALPVVPKGVSIKYFGAKGDGLADDTQAFLDALKKVEGAIEIPAGRYKITKIIEITRPGVVLRGEVEKSLSANKSDLVVAPGGLTVVSIVGVNGTGKTTTSAKLAYFIQSQRKTALLAACDTFRAAAIEQIKLWGERLKIEVVAGTYGADAASVAHDAITAARARKADYLFIDTAGRLHTKHNLMQELQKLHRVIGKQLPGAPHEVLLVLDATTGMNALNQAREFNKAVPLSGLVVTKLDGTSKGGMVVAIQKELGLPIKFIGLGEQADDLQPFDAKQFAQALFEE